MTVAFADVVITPSQHMLDWMQASGWTLPAISRILPNPVPMSLRAVAADALERRVIRELVFFDRLESRKSLLVLARAVALLPAEVLSRVRVTFLGKVPVPNGPREFDALSFLRKAMPEAADWSVIDDYDATQAVEYLSGTPERLAVMPSLMENSPMTVVECGLDRNPGQRRA
jgi:O-antigen biosynthesis protein